MSSPTARKKTPRLNDELVLMFVGLVVFMGITLIPEIYASMPLPNPYVNHQYGFSIKYPDGWHSRENYKVRTLAPEDNYTAAVAFRNGSTEIAIEKIPLHDKTFDDFVASRIAHEQAAVPGKYDFEIRTVSQTRLNGLPAYYVVAHFKGTSGFDTDETYFIADGPSAFDITLACSDPDCPAAAVQFEKSVHSIRFDS